MTTAAAEATFTIGQVSEATGLTTHTLRFYEKEQLLLGPVARFDPNAVALLQQARELQVW